ncbi:MAG: hypothetical protein R2861_13980 [Desulfobacterales bacterium]
MSAISGYPGRVGEIPGAHHGNAFGAGGFAPLKNPGFLSAREKTGMNMQISNKFHMVIV